MTEGAEKKKQKKTGAKQAKRRAAVVRAAEKMVKVDGVEYPAHSGSRSIAAALKLDVCARTVRRDLLAAGLKRTFGDAYQHGKKVKFKPRKTSATSF